MKIWRRLLPSLGVCAILAIFAGKPFWNHLVEFWRSGGARDRILQALFILALAWLISKLAMALFTALESRQAIKQVPYLLKNIIVVAIFALAIFLILAWIYEVPPSSLVATSGVAGVILGLAFRDTIADVFAGISLNAERPFAIGDWIRLVGLESEPLTGCVEDIDWRTTKIRTADNVIVVVPNSKMRMMSLTNFTVAGNRSRFRLPVCLEDSLPVDQVLQVLQQAALAAEGPLPEPPAEAQIDCFRADLGCVQYQVVYWLNPSLVSPQRGRSMVAVSVLKHLQNAGIELNIPNQSLILRGESFQDSLPS